MSARIYKRIIYTEVEPVTDTGAYSDADVLFIATKIPFFSNRAAKLVSVALLDQADQGVAIDLYIMRSQALLGVVNAAITITDAAANEILAAIPLLAASYVDLVGCQFVQAANIGMVVKPDGQDLWVAGAVRSGTPTYAAGSLKLKLGFEVDEIIE